MRVSPLADRRVDAATDDPAADEPAVDEPAVDDQAVDGAVIDDPATTVLTPVVLREWPLPLDDDGDKHERGTVVVIGGSARTPGAVLLSGIAALRAGAGRLQIATVAPAAVGLALALPEALIEPLPATDDGAIDVARAADAVRARVEHADVVLVGPGLDASAPDEATALLGHVMAAVHERAVVVLDALALTCLPEVPASLRRGVGGRLVLTPNRDEARRANREGAGEGDEGDGGGRGNDGTAEATHGPDAAARRDALDLAARYDAVVATHGWIAAPDGRAWRLDAGGVGLGTSGSGDVLAGLVAGIAARTGDAVPAALWGAYVHAASGDRLARGIGPVGFLARELLDEAPHVLAEASR